MRPLDELEDARLARVGLLAFDVDDTVTERGKLAARSLLAMETLRDAGVKLVAVTGRPLGWAEIALRQWPIDASCGENGAGWFHLDGGRLVARTVDEDAARVGEARARALAIGREVAPALGPPSDGWARRMDVAFDIGEHVRAPASLVAELDEALRRAGFRTVSSSIHLHAAHGDWDKATGLVHCLRDAFGSEFEDAREERVLFVGDSPNDAAAFRAFPLSVGVANVVDHALDPPPAYVTREPRSRGFEELAWRILAARGRS